MGMVDVIGLGCHDCGSIVVEDVVLLHRELGMNVSRCSIYRPLSEVAIAFNSLVIPNPLQCPWLL
jgi:hypothetical protein